MTNRTLATLLGDKIIGILAAFLILAVIVATFIAHVNAAAPDNGVFYFVPDTPSMPQGIAYGVSFKSGSSYLAAVAENGDNDVIVIIDTETLEEVLTIEPAVGQLTTIAFSEDGQYLVVGGDELLVYSSSSANPAEWSDVYSINETSVVNSVAFTESGEYLAVLYAGGAEERLHILDMWEEDITPVVIDIESLEEELPHYVIDVTFNIDGSYLVITGEGGVSNNLTVLETTTWSVVADAPEIEGMLILAATFSPDGNYLLLTPDGSTDDTLSVVDVSSTTPAGWEEVRRFSPHETTGIWAMEFSPDGSTVAMAYWNEPYFGALDVSDPNPLNWEALDTAVGTLDGGKAGNEGQGVAYSPDGEYIAVAMEGGSGLAIIRTSTGTSPFDGGTGAEEDPYEVSTCEQLQSLDYYLDDHFVLTDDIDCSMTNPLSPDFDADGIWGSENGFNPIGGVAGDVYDIAHQNFTGSLDGQGYTISDLYINRTADEISGYYIGLFASIGNGGSVSNLGLVDVDISGHSNVGALAGGLAGTATNVYSTGSVFAEDGRVGGLVGVHTDDNSFPNSSPLVYAWNGEEYTYTTDVGSLLPNNVESQDIAQIDSRHIAPKGGKYSFRITEEYNEVVYYDQLALMTFDHAPGYSVALPLNRDAGQDDLRTVQDVPTHPLIACTDEEGNDCLDALVAFDDAWSYTNTNNRYNPENLNQSWVLDFGDLSEAEEIQLVLRGARDYAASAEYPGSSARSIQVKDMNGEWVEVYGKSEIGSDGSPRLRTIDLTDKFLSDDYRVKVVFGTFNANYFAIDTAAQVPFVTNVYAPESVDLDFHGFTAIDRTYFFDHDYYDVSPVPPELFRNQYGSFTKYGDVTPLLAERDDHFAIMRYGDQLSVEFPYVAPAEGTVRSFALLNEAYYKHATNDDLGEYGENADYLPYAGMSEYGPGMAAYPSTPENDAYRAEWNTRVYEGPFADALRSRGSTIIDSYSTATVEGNGDVGGLVGYNEKEIRGSYSAGTVIGNWSVGGLVGYNYNSSDAWIHDSYSTSNVTAGGGYIGGFVGTNTGSIENSYSSGSIETDSDSSYVGGFAGEIWINEEWAGDAPQGIHNSFTVSEIVTESTDYIGGFAGIAPSAHDLGANNNYWFNSYTFGIGDDSHEGQPTKVESASYFFTTSTQPPLDQWDFEDVWVTNAGALPTFIGSESEGTFTLSYSAGTGGTISGTTNQSVAEGASGSAVTAVANSGYRFVRWSDSSTTNPRTDTNVTQNISVSAQFERTSDSGRSGGSVRTTVSTTVASLQSQLRTLLEQYKALTGKDFGAPSSESPTTEVRDLEMGMEGEDVRMLQTILINLSYSIPPGATGFFGTYTRDALAKYQAENAIAPAVGYFGSITRAQMKGAGLPNLWW